MSDRPINNDDLGAKGEARFRELCADAALVCNKSEQDRMGWDFIVESLPGTLPGPSGLDQRGPGLSCRVQVKTHWLRESDRVPVKLSAAERLAKDPGPAFICIFTVDEKLRIVGSHLVHMLDENLSRVLKRLRESQADTDSKPVNEQDITFGAARAGVETAEPLRVAVIKDVADFGSFVASVKAQSGIQNHAVREWEEPGDTDAPSG
ncbi:MAG TPA: hypothetical protein VF699_12660 [Caulobacteraceae bacterium]|jgi:hypothetical protein